MFPGTTHSRFWQYAVLIGAITFASISAQDVHFTYQGRRIILEVDNRAIVVRAPNQHDLAAVRTTVESMFGRRVSIDETGAKDWWRVDLQEPTAALRRILDDVLAATPGIAATPVLKTPKGGTAIVMSRVILRSKSPMTSDEIRKNLASFSIDGIEERACGLERVFAVTVKTRSGFEVLETANAIAAMPWIEWAEPDMLVSGRSSSCNGPDPLLVDQWFLRNFGQNGGTPGMDVDAQSTWYRLTSPPTIRVAILDTGIELTHPDLNVVGGTDTSTMPHPAFNGSWVNVNESHGTRVAGCIGAKFNNGIGGAGVVPGCPLLSVRFGMESPLGGIQASPCSLAAGIDWARTVGLARITVSAFELDLPSSVIELAYETAAQFGISNFVAAGNDGLPGLDFPASIGEGLDIGPVIAVGAIDRTGTRLGFSNTSPNLDFVGPGVDIVTTDLLASNGAPGDYTSAQGTSFATPIVAGVAALNLELDPLLSREQLELLLRSSAIDLGPTGRDAEHGYGLPRAGHALIPSLPHAYIGIPEGNPFDDFGRAIDGTADLDADGIADIVVGCERYDVVNPQNGQVLVDHGAVFAYSGKSHALLWTHQEISEADARVGFSVAVIGDVNGDAKPDIAVGILRRKRLGQTQGSVKMISGANGATLWEQVPVISPGADFGCSVARISDCSADADSVPDVLVGARFQGVGTTQPYSFGSSFTGNVFRLSGLDGQITYSLTSPGVSGDAQLGSSLAAVGDLDGDMVDDFVAGAPLDQTNSPSARGAVIAYNGVTGDAIWGYRGTDPNGTYVNSGLGRAVVGTADLNNDGKADIVTCASNATLLGSPNRIAVIAVSGVDGARIWTHDAGHNDAPAPQGSLMGLVNVGDYNGDSYGDVAVGVDDANGGSGFVKIVSGLSNSIPIWTFNGDRLGALGCAVSEWKSDRDMDGRSELLVGQNRDGYFAPGTGSVLGFYSRDITNIIQVPDLTTVGTSLGNPAPPPLNLFHVNSHSGGATNTVNIAPFEPMTFELFAPPTAPSYAFIMYAFIGVARAADFYHLTYPLFGSGQPVQTTIGNMYFSPLGPGFELFSSFSPAVGHLFFGPNDPQLPLSPFQFTLPNLGIPPDFDLTLQAILVVNPADPINGVRVSNGIRLHFN